MNITDMNFYDGGFNGCDRVADSDGGMGIAPWIQDNPVAFKSGALKFVYQLPFHITLKIVKYYGRKRLLETDIKLFKAFLSIDTWFPNTEQVQIGAIDDGYFHNTRMYKKEESKEKRSGSVLFHQVNKIIEQIPAVKWTRGAFRVILYTESRCIF